MRILFMGGHELGKITLEYLINQGRNIVGVVITDTDNEWYRGVDEVAQKYQLQLFKEKNVNDLAFIEKLNKLSPSLIVVVNFEQILKETIINLPSKGCINTHASLLPKYRGRAPLNWAILNGEKQTGVTVHYIEKGIDTGEIILQNTVEIKDDDYIGDLLEKVKAIYPIIVDEAIMKIQNNQVNPLKQDLSKGFYCGKRTAKDGQINWGKPVNEVYNLIRAVSRPYPGAYTYYEGNKLIIWKAQIEGQQGSHKENRNGSILGVEDGEILVKVDGGNLLLTEYEFTDTPCKVIVNGEFYFKED